MRTVIKKISLNDSFARISSTVPALVHKWLIPSLNSSQIYYSYADALLAAKQAMIDEDKIEEYTEFQEFDNTDFSSLTSNGNYGLIPSDIEIPSDIISSVSDQTDLFINIPDENGSYYNVSYLTRKRINEEFIGGTTYFYYYNKNIYSILWNNAYLSYSIEKIVTISALHKYLSFKTLVKWYKYFIAYYNMLHVGLMYFSSAEEYYINQIEEKSDSEEEKYTDMDTLIESRGGQKLYQWMCNNCFVTYTLPSNVVSYWGSDMLYFSEVKKWYNILSVRYNKFHGHDISEYDQCSKDYCLFTDYLKRGGDSFFIQLKEWINGLSIEPNAILSSEITLPILITTTIDDIGEMSIFSNEWESGTDYSSTLSKTPSGGTVVNRPIITDDETGDSSISNSIYIIKSGQNAGYTHNSYNENVFNADDWNDYTDFYLNQHSGEVVTNISTYAYNRQNKIIYNPSDEKMAETYTINNSDGLIVFNGIEYPIEQHKYVIYKGLSNSVLNGEKVLVNKALNGIYYATVNGKNYFAKSKGNGYYFNFVSNQTCLNTSDYDTKAFPSGEETISCVVKGNSIYPLTLGEDIEIEHNGYKYRCPLLDGSVTIDGNTYYLSGSTLMQYDGFAPDENDDTVMNGIFSEGNGGWKTDTIYPIASNDILYVVFPFTIHKYNQLTGETDSKLSKFKGDSVLVDDYGNQMPGLYSPTFDSDKEKAYFETSDAEKENASYTAPYNGCRLDLYYKVGNTSSLSKNASISSDYSENMQYYNGDILNKMTFYYKNEDSDEIITDSIVEITTDNTDDITVISAITSSKTLADAYVEANAENSGITISLSESIYCKFEYNIGAILREKVEYNSVKDLYSYNGYELDVSHNSGIKYTEVYELKDSICQYYINDGTSFSLKYYDLIPQNTKYVDYDGSGNNNVEVAIANFEMMIFTLSVKDGKIQASNKKFSTDEGFDKYNGFMAAPLFRLESDFGNSLPQIADGDIYIDRGIAKSIDKHLRLQEIKTMDSLVQYENGSIFNINEQ